MIDHHPVIIGYSEGKINNDPFIIIRSVGSKENIDCIMINDACIINNGGGIILNVEGIIINYGGIIFNDDSIIEKSEGIIVNATLQVIRFGYF